MMYLILDGCGEEFARVEAESHEDAAERWAHDCSCDFDDWSDEVHVECVETGECRLVTVDVQTVVEVDAVVVGVVPSPRLEREAREAIAAAATEPPDDVWVMCPDGHEWATDGVLAIRRDAPRPASMRWCGKNWMWRREPLLPELVAEVLAGLGGPAFQPFAARAAPVLRAGMVCCTGKPWACAVIRDGEAIAIVMALRDAYGHEVADVRDGVVVEVRDA